MGNVRLCYFSAPILIFGHFSLQRTHLAYRQLHKLIPLKTRGINLRNQLIINCVRCSEKKRRKQTEAHGMGGWAGPIPSGSCGG